MPGGHAFLFGKHFNANIYNQKLRKMKCSCCLILNN